MYYYAYLYSYIISIQLRATQTTELTSVARKSTRRYRINNKLITCNSKLFPGEPSSSTTTKL